MHEAEEKAASTAHGPRRIMVLGATGTIGRATVAALSRRGHEVVGFARTAQDTANPLHAAIGSGPGKVAVRRGEVTDPLSLRRDGFAGERFDTLVSCLASRSGTPKDAWAIDHQAHLEALAAARSAGVSHMVLLSAICVQKPRLAFQHAKLAFEAALMESGLTYAIVRPTAFFKSLSGQVDRVRQGKPFVLFGDGRLTACKPISDRDLAEFLADCVEDPGLRNRILPVGGPGAAVTPIEQGERLFELLGRKPRFRRVPVELMSAVAGSLGVLGRVIPPFADKAELARIGHYYATESMLLFDPETGRYDAQATPSYGEETLFDHYERLLSGEAHNERVDRRLF